MISAGDDRAATLGQLKKVYKKLDSRIDEAFDAISEGDGVQAEFWNEHEDKLERLRRRMNRLERRLQALEGNE